MAVKTCSDEEFLAYFSENGAAGTAKILGINLRAVQNRRRRLEIIHGVRVNGPQKAPNQNAIQGYDRRINVEVNDGVVLIGSDPHYWPDETSPGHAAMLKLIKKLKPKAVVINGDAFDGARISRFPSSGWSKRPTVKQEIEAVSENLHEIWSASKEANHVWCIGNHDMRFETKLSNATHEFEGVAGFALKDHFPAWSIGVSLWINDSVVVKHRFKGGIHCSHNNTLWAGKTMITGHTHSLKVTPFDDYNGTRWGVDTGTMANPSGPQFEYAEDNPANQRCGLIVLTFRDGELLWPEVCRVVDGKAEFRGEVFDL